MAAEQPTPSTTAKLFRPRNLVIMVALVAAGVVLRQGWNILHIELATAPQYRLTTDTVQLVPAEVPPWIRRDVKAEVFRDSGLTDSISLLDPPSDIQQRLIDAFELHPWVREVTRVELVGPGHVEVALEYREPVAVAELARDETRELLPVDAESVRLPDEDLTDTEKAYLPRIRGIEGRPLVGAVWADQRMQGAVNLATKLRQVWEPYSLLDIVPSEYPEVVRTYRFYVYELRASGGTTIRWGAAPGYSPPGESTFDEKLTRLAGYVRQYGRLDTIDSPELIDVRDTLHVKERIAQEDGDPADGQLR